MSPEETPQPSGNVTSAALQRARRPADAATTFGIIAMVFGIISITTHALGAAAVAMGVLGLVFVWRGPGTQSEAVKGAKAPGRGWRQTAAVFSIIGIALGAVGLVQTIASYDVMP